MKRTVVFVALIAGLANLPGQAQKNDRPEMLLEAAKQKAILEGDCKGAIKEYKDIAARFASNHNVAATAMLRMADCYRQHDDAAWRKTLNEMISKYPDQKVAVEQARERIGGTAPRETVQRKIWSTGASDADPKVAGILAVSPDGHYIVHPTPMRGLSSLVVHDLSSGTNRILELGDGNAYDPFITPESKRVFYTWFKVKEDVGELRMVKLDGTGMRSLTPGAGYVAYDVPGVTADGKLAAVGLGRNGTWQIGLLSLETRDLQILKNLGWRETYVGNFSPDGRWLVYSAQLKNDSPDRAVYVIATDGSAEPSVVVPGGLRGSATPRFTPDGSRVVFPISRSGRSELWSVRIKDGKRVGDPEFVRQNPGSGEGFSPDGTYYYSERAFSSSQYVVQVDPSTWKPKNAPARISDPFRNESVQAPYWSPDGKRLAYLASVAEARFVIHDFDSGQDRELPARAGALRGWFADGKSLQVAGPSAGLRLVDIETQQERPISLAGANQPVASTDGKAVFYSMLESAPYERGKEPASDTFRLMRRDLDTGADKELYRAEAKPFGISLRPSPDGRSLAFAFTRPDENLPRLWILPLSGGESRELLRYDGRYDEVSAWTQDSRAILFVRSGEIWVQPIDGREAYATGITFNGLSAPSVSPDGDRIAFRGNTSTQSVWTIKNLFPDTSSAKR